MTAIFSLALLGSNLSDSNRTLEKRERFASRVEVIGAV
jgi:hypothetical protein